MKKSTTILTFPIHYSALNIPSVATAGSHRGGGACGRLNRRATYFEKGSDFPVGKPLPCVLVSTFPQCTATWLSLCSTVLQYSCCGGTRTGQEESQDRGGMHVCCSDVHTETATHLHLGSSGLLVKAHGHGVAGYPEEVRQRHRFPLRTERALNVTRVDPRQVLRGSTSGHC